MATVSSPTNVIAYLYISYNEPNGGRPPSGLYVTWNYTGTATFTITPYVDGVAQTALITTSTTNNVTFTNLTLNIFYYFKVTATSGGKTSTPSLASNTEKYINRILYNLYGSDAQTSNSTRIDDIPIDVVIPSNVYIGTQLYTVTGMGANFDFNGQCARLSSIYMPDSLISIGYGTFNWHATLKKIRFSKDLTVLHGYFQETSIEIIDTSYLTKLPYIENWTFYHMPKVTKVLVGPNIASIGANGLEWLGTALSGTNAEHRSTKLDVYFYGINIPTINQYNFRGINNTFPYPCTAYVLPNATNVSRITSHVNITYGNAPIFTDVKVFLPEPTDITGFLYQNVDNSLPTGIILSWNCLYDVPSYLINIYDSINATVPIKIITSNGTAKTYTITSSDNLSEGTYYFTIQSYSQTANVSSIESLRTSSIDYNISLKYKINDSSTASISGSISNITSINIIPNNIKIIDTIYTINKINDNVFSDQSSLTSINISSNIQIIGISAFENCTNLSSVTLSSNIDSIGNNAFKNCSALTTITLPSSLSNLGTSVFQNCNLLASVSISSTNITSILASTFDGCSLLNTIQLPNLLSSIDVTALLNCDNLSSISITSTNTNFSTENGILFNKTRTSLIFYPAKKTDTLYSIPSSVLSLSDYSFHENHYLRELIFNASIQTVGKYVFNNINLNMSFFSTVPTFDSLSFSNTANIAYKLSTTSNITNLSVNNFTEIKTITAPTNIKLYPYIANTTDNVSGIFLSWTNTASSISSAVISLYLSNGVNSLSSFNITNPSEVTSFIINNNLSYNQTYRVKITITISTGDSLTSDYSPTLYYTNNVVYLVSNNICVVSGFKYNPSNVTINSQVRVNQNLLNVTGINSTAFRNCVTLITVTIPDTVTMIDTYAFEGCSALTTVSFSNNISLIKKGAFKGCSSLNNIIMPSPCTSLYEEVFMDCVKLDNITLSQNLVRIYANAFNGCSKLMIINIPSSVVNIDPIAFINCNKFEQIIVSQNNTRYLSNDGILFNKDNTTLELFPMGKNTSSYTIPNNITIIGDYAFQQSLYITTLNLNNVTTLGICCFKSCIFTTITIPNTVTTIGNGAFSFCSNLTTFVVNTNNTLFSVSDGIIFSLDLKTLILYPVGKNQSSYTIPSTIENIGPSAFESAQKLTNIILNNNIKVIGDYAFRYCINISTLSIPTSIVSIGTNAFADNPGLKISFLSNKPLVFNLPSLNIVILSDLVKLLEDSGVDFTGDVVVNVEISASIINNTFIFKTTTPSSLDLTNTIYKINSSLNNYDDVIPKIETSYINYDGGITSGYIDAAQETPNLPYEYLCYVSHIKKNTTNGIRGILQVSSFISSMSTKINNAFKSILQNLSEVEQAYSDSSNILSLSILQEISANDPSRLLNIQGTTLGNNWYPNLVQPGDYLYYTVTIEPHSQQTGITQNRVYLFKAKVI